MTYEKKLRKISDLCDAIHYNRRELVRLAVKDLHVTVRNSSEEVDIVLDRLAMFREAGAILENRYSLGGPGSSVSLMLSYNGSSWLNIAITSIYMVGNRVNVRFSSKAAELMNLTEEMYRPIFGDEVKFHRGEGKGFLEASLRDPAVSSVVIFGFDENIRPYESAFRKAGKKLVFEGPGQDPFIVFSEADMDLVFRDLMAAKFWYSGQTCTAPKRIFVQQPIYDEFLETFIDKVKKLSVGDPADMATDVSSVASRLAVARIAAQLEDARRKGATIPIGGRIEGNLIHPTVVENASDDMLGMREEVFGPVAFTSSFRTRGEVLRRATTHKYGLRAAVFGGADARYVSEALKGEEYCHPVRDYTFGKFGTVALNLTRSESWRGAFVTKPVGGYGYSGWIWETVDGKFRIKQGPKLLSLETSTPVN